MAQALILYPSTLGPHGCLVLRNIKVPLPHSVAPSTLLLWECHILPSWLRNLGWKVTELQAAAEGST